MESDYAKWLKKYQPIAGGTGIKYANYGDEKNEVAEFEDESKVWTIVGDQIISGYQHENAEGYYITEIGIVDGEKTNIKITTSEREQEPEQEPEQENELNDLN